MKKVIIGIFYMVLLCQVSGAEVLILKNNYYIDDVTILRRWQNMIIFDYQRAIYQIDESYILKVRDAIPLEGNLLQPQNIQDYVEKVQPVKLVQSNISTPNQVEIEQPSNSFNARAAIPEKTKPKIAYPGLEPKPIAKLPSYYKSTSKWIMSCLIGTNYYEMKQVNKFINDTNEILEPFGVPSIKNIDNDFGVDGAMGIRFNDIFEFGWQLCSLSAATKNGDSTLYHYELSIPAFESMGYIKFFVPLSKNSRIGIGVALGWIYVSGDERIQYYDDYRGTVRVRNLVQGEAFSVKTMASFDIDLSSSIGLTFLIGYRNATISEVKLDYSGLQLKTGLYLMFGEQD